MYELRHVYNVKPRHCVKRHTDGYVVIMMRSQKRWRVCRCAHLVGQALPDAAEALVVGGLLPGQQRRRLRGRQPAIALGCLCQECRVGVRLCAASILTGLQGHIATRCRWAIRTVLHRNA